jgi:prenyltransferase/squalene oxidase-like repeat protein
VDVRAAVRRLRSSGWWSPAAVAYQLRATRLAGQRHVPTDDVALQAAAAWLTRAQDASADGGIAGRYRIVGGWSSSYPETTGYAIPTLLTLARVLDDPSYVDRASRCIDFLLSIQLPSGAFPALAIADNRTEPSPFNSAQIVHGLHRWHVERRDERVLDAMHRAASWICDVQDADGAWRQHFYQRLACTYSAQAACWLAEVGAHLDEPRFLRAAEKNLRWVLGHRDSQTGWIDACGFSREGSRAPARAYTHDCLHARWTAAHVSSARRR